MADAVLRVLQNKLPFLPRGVGHRQHPPADSNLVFFGFERSNEPWESGDPVPGFPFLHGGREPELRECGNRASDFQGWWAARENLHLVFLAVHLFLIEGFDLIRILTWVMGERQVPQPDITLRVLPEFGGQSGIAGEYHSGAPELIVEVAVSSHSRDFGAKKRLYERMGVRELSKLNKILDVRFSALTRCLLFSFGWKASNLK